MVAAILVTLFLAPTAGPSVTVTVDGEGYLRFAREGRAVYAREATLVVQDGALRHPTGLNLLPPVSVPGSPQSVTVDLEGRIVASYAGQSRELGRIVLALFEPSSAPLEEDGFFIATDRPRLGDPGAETHGVIRTVGEPTAQVPREAPTRPARPVPTRAEAPNPGPGLPQPEDTAQPAPVVRPFEAPKPTEEFLRAGGVQIVINEYTEVQGETFAIGEIATVYANADRAAVIAAVDLGRTPPLGVERVLDRVMLLSRLRLAFADAEKFVIVSPTKPKVTRQGRRVTHHELVQAATAAARERVGADASLRAATPGPDMAVPLGDLVLVGENPAVTGANVTVTVSVFVDGRRINSRVVRLVNDSPIADLRVGQAVRVRVRSNAAVVETSGRVKGVDAATGQVTVETDTKAILTGRLTPDGFVEVGL